MTPSVLPTDAEIDEVILGPDSLVWQRFGDIRLFAASGYALLLQVAHPTVGAGVRDHSTFEKDPWGRLLRTTDYLFLLVYGGRDAAAMGRRLRDLHRSIKGVNPDRSRYHALEPEAYAWVHATLIDGALKAHERFVRKLRPGEADRFYAEYEPLGRLIGVRPGDLPDDWAGFRAYFDRIESERLEHNETVDRVLRLISEPAAPPPGLERFRRLWRVVRVPPGRALRTATIGLMSDRLRAHLGLEWTAANEAELRAMGAVSKAVGPLLPRPLRVAGPRYLRWRAAEIARGPLGPPADRDGATGDGLPHAA
jgi:uncharacterized protein (DUF2236 family)